MPRDYWDFDSHVEDLERIFERPPDEFLDDYYKPAEWGPNGVIPTLRAWRRTVVVRPVAPPDPPKFIRVWNERANAEQPEWIKRANRQALEDAVAEDTGDA